MIHALDGQHDGTINREDRHFTHETRNILPGTSEQAQDIAEFRLKSARYC